MNKSSLLLRALMGALASIPASVQIALGNGSVPFQEKADRGLRSMHPKRLKRGSVKTSWPGQTEAQRDQRLAAAQAKRLRKSVKLERDMTSSFGNNYAHWPLHDRHFGNMPKRPYPFYVAH